jgi:hypothetical protein
MLIPSRTPKIGLVPTSRLSSTARPRARVPVAARKILGPAVQTLLTISLWPIEKALVRWAGSPEYPFCFLIGPPRSGTTLCYELLVRRFHFAYLSNLAQTLPRVPAAATMMAAPLISAWRGRFESEYGYIRGWGAPNEGGWLWNRWFPQDHHLDPLYAGRLPSDRIRRIVAAISNAMKAPFLNKYVPHSAHVRLLDKIFPGCLFIEVYRDPIANVRSIVRARADNQYGSMEWLAVKPREWEQYRSVDDVRRASAQVYYIHRNIEEDMRTIDPNRRLIIDYGKMCGDPRSTLDDVASFSQGHHIKLRIKDDVPESFRPSIYNRLVVVTQRRICASVESLWATKGLASGQELTPGGMASR